MYIYIYIYIYYVVGGCHRPLPPGESAPPGLPAGRRAASI